MDGSGYLISAWVYRKGPFDFPLYLACTIFSRDGVESLVSVRDAFKPVMTDTRLSVRGVFNPKFA